MTVAGSTPIPVVTIDGPASSGKGTVAAALAGRLDWHLLDSGAIYRVVAYGVLQQQLDGQDVEAVLKLIRDMALRFSNGHIWYNVEDVTYAIRTPACSEATSQISAIADVRAALLKAQRSFMREPGLVADGRDMGTVVFPDAGLKIFLTASARVRAERRLKQLSNQGISVNLADLERDIMTRDERDSNRAVSPLRPADDAMVIDSSTMTPEEVLDTILQQL